MARAKKKKGSTASTRKPKTPREVVRVITDTELVKQWRSEIERGHVEIKERKDGSWVILSPQEGWIGCDPECKVRHKHQTEAPMDQVAGVWESPEEAYELAQRYAGTREVRVVPLNGTMTSSQPLVCDDCGNEFAPGTGATFELDFKDGRLKVGAMCDACVAKLSQRTVRPIKPKPPKKTVTKKAPPKK